MPRSPDLDAPSRRQVIVEQVLSRFAEAERKAGAQSVDIVVAGHLVRLRFAGAALLSKVVPALAHLVAPTAPEAVPALSVCFWDRQSTGVGMIPPPWPLEGIGADSVIAGATEDGLRATFRIDRGVFTLLDVEARVCAIWMRDVTAIDRHDAAAPLRPQLASYFAKYGLAVTHGAAIATGGRGVLLGGRGGSGKSTTSLLCLEAGFDFAGDDYVLVDPGTGGDHTPPYVHSLYSTAKVLPRGGTRLPRIGDAFAEEPVEALSGDKAIAYLAPHVGARLSTGFPLVALLLPTVTGRPETRAVPISAAVALRGIAPSTILQNGDEGPRTLAILAGLASRLPCYRLELGSELEQIPMCIERIIAANG